MYDSEEDIERLVRDFESCTIAAADFHHREHLVVAVWYLQTLSRDEAVAQMRAALLRFIDHHGVDPKKYSEEVTVFWVNAIATHLGGIGGDVSPVKKCNPIIRPCKPAKSPNRPTAHKPATPGAAAE